MTIVSHFELIFKPQAPASPPGVNVDRVIQGYFLEITNLESVPLRYRLEFVVVPPAPATPNAQFRNLSGNTLVFIDRPSSDNQSGILAGAPAATVFTPSTGLILIAPNETALVAVLPSAFGPNPLDPTPLALPNFEVRGFVRLTVPALFNFQPPFFFERIAQAEAPVKVLLTPQNRATFFNAANAITGQAQATLTIVGGSAQTVIVPEPGGPIVFNQLQLSESEGRSVADLLDSDPRIAQPEVLAALLGQLDRDLDLASMNRMLAESGAGLAVERRGGE